MGAAGPYWVTAHPVSWLPYEWPVGDDRQINSKDQRSTRLGDPRLLRPLMPSAPTVREPSGALTGGVVGEQIFHITETQAEAVVEPNSVTDDLGWKAVSAIAEQRGRHPRTLPAAAST